MPDVSEVSSVYKPRSN